MNDLNFKTLLDSIGLSEEDSASMLGLFYVGFYKILLETILAIDGDNKKTVSQIGTFLVTLSKQIPEAKKPDFEKVVMNEKIKLAIQLLNNLKELIPETGQNKLSVEVQKLTELLRETRRK